MSDLPFFQVDFLVTVVLLPILSALALLVWAGRAQTRWSILLISAMAVCIHFWSNLGMPLARTGIHSEDLGLMALMTLTVSRDDALGLHSWRHVGTWLVVLLLWLALPALMQSGGGGIPGVQTCLVALIGGLSLMINHGDDEDHRMSLVHTGLILALLIGAGLMAGSARTAQMAGALGSFIAILGVGALRGRNVVSAGANLPVMVSALGLTLFQMEFGDLPWSVGLIIWSLPIGSLLVARRCRGIWYRAGFSLVLTGLYALLMAQMWPDEVHGANEGYPPQATSSFDEVLNGDEDLPPPPEAKSQFEDEY